MPISVNVPRGTLPTRSTAPIVPRGTFSLNSVASSLGTDRKTMLLIGLAGLVGGYLLTKGIQSTRRALHRTARRTRSLASSVATPRNLMIVGTVGLGLGAAYWYYRQHHAAASSVNQAAAYVHPPAKPKLQLPARPA